MCDLLVDTRYSRVKILWPELLFFEGAYCKYNKKSKHFLSLTILGF